ncbi:hypothetical protein HMPREF9162_1125 [Selenomonas sp. oral taxon 137 str. F0430]|nr:hypothetical protein HMPREF9162_1125 [Selenomonas sp. oral taxon 137 str. F0430]
MKKCMSGARAYFLPLHETSRAVPEYRIEPAPLKTAAAFQHIAA